MVWWPVRSIMVVLLPLDDFEKNDGR